MHSFHSHTGIPYACIDLDLGRGYFDTFKCEYANTHELFIIIITFFVWNGVTRQFNHKNDSKIGFQSFTSIQRSEKSVQVLELESLDIRMVIPQHKQHHTITGSMNFTEVHTWKQLSSLFAQTLQTEKFIKLHKLLRIIQLKMLSWRNYSACFRLCADSFSIP